MDRFWERADRATMEARRMKGTTVANEAKQKAMRDAIEVLIKRHDKQADEDNPIGPGEFGRMTCGCRDCVALKAVLAETQP